MFANPMVLALIAGNLMATGFILYATGVGVRILLFWEPASSRAAQLNLERKTYLISSVLVHVIGIQILSLFLFIYTLDQLHELFPGAMCAAGTLNVNANGYLALGLKLAGFVSGSLWLIMRHVDKKAPDYPLIMIQHGWLCVICIIWCAETYYLFRYFLELKPQIITSCCGTIFNANAEGFAAETAHLNLSMVRPGFWSLFIATLMAGSFFLRRQQGDWFFALLGSLLLPVSLVAIISYLCLYIYELPTHHCPFCLLQKEYGYVGYLLYGSVFVGGIAAVGVGMLRWFKKHGSLKLIVPVLQKRLCQVSLAGFVVFGLTATYPMLFTDFKLP